MPDSESLSEHKGRAQVSDWLERGRISRQYVTPEILTLMDNKCQFQDCRCHKKKKLKFLNRIKYIFKHIINNNLDI